jgi:hypothetical protein
MSPYYSYWQVKFLKNTWNWHDNESALVELLKPRTCHCVHLFLSHFPEALENQAKL